MNAAHLQQFEQSVRLGGDIEASLSELERRGPSASDLMGQASIDDRLREAALRALAEEPFQSSPGVIGN